MLQKPVFVRLEGWAGILFLLTSPLGRQRSLHDLANEPSLQALTLFTFHSFGALCVFRTHTVPVATFSTYLATDPSRSFEEKYRTVVRSHFILPPSPEHRRPTVKDRLSCSTQLRDHAFIVMQDSGSTSPAAPMLPELALSLDLMSDNHMQDTGTASETTTLNERYDSLRSSRRSSICSYSTDNSHSFRAPKVIKRVRFEESVSWSYFDDSIPESTRPELEKKPSFLGRSWQRLRQRNSSTEFDLEAGTATDAQDAKRRSISVDLVEMAPKASRKSARSEPKTNYGFSIQQPLRESTGRKYNRADTQISWRTSTQAPKGDWGALLGSARPASLVV